LQRVAQLGYPAPGDKKIFALPSTKTADFEVK